MITQPKLLNAVMAKEIKQRVRNRDNPLLKKNPIKVLVDYSNVLNDFKSNYGLMDGGFCILSIIAFNWLTSNKGITVWGIVKTAGRKGNTFAATKIAIDGLIRKGLIEVIGTGKQGAYLYILTKQGEDEFGLLVKSMYV